MLNPTNEDFVRAQELANQLYDELQEELELPFGYCGYDNPDLQVRKTEIKAAIVEWILMPESTDKPIWDYELIFHDWCENGNILHECKYCNSKLLEETRMLYRG